MAKILNAKALYKKDLLTLKTLIENELEDLDPKNKDFVLDKSPIIVQIQSIIESMNNLNVEEQYTEAKTNKNKSYKSISPKTINMFYN